MQHLTTRDIECINFISRTNLYMTSSQIAQLFYKTSNDKSSKTVANRRLSLIVQKRQLKRVRQYVSQEFIYYAKSLPSKIEHKKLMVDFLCKLKAIGIHFDLSSVETEVRTWQKDYQIRPDLLLTIESLIGEKYHLIVECDISKKFTSQKYAKFIERRSTDTAITNVLTNKLIIVSLCDKIPQPIQLADGRIYKATWIKSDFSNISNLSYLFI